jgi:hypothetical protein
MEAGRGQGRCGPFLWELKWLGWPTTAGRFLMDYDGNGSMAGAVASHEKHGESRLSCLAPWRRAGPVCGVNSISSAGQSPATSGASPSSFGLGRGKGRSAFVPPSAAIDRRRPIRSSCVQLHDFTDEEAAGMGRSRGPERRRECSAGRLEARCVFVVVR